MHVLAPLLLILVTIAWFLLALVPALHEHFKRSDVEPLRVASAAADIRYFGISFQAFVNKQLALLQERATTTVPHVTTLADESPVWYAPVRDEESPVPSVFAGASAEKIAEGLVVIAEGSLRVPNGAHVLKELYAGGTLDAGANCVLRAVLARGDATLGPQCEVLRWVSTGGAFHAGTGSVLWGRASSWGTMTLGEGVQFQRLGAPRMEMGWPISDVARDMRERPAMEPTARVTIASSRWVVDGDFAVPAGVSVSADLIVSGTLRVGTGALLNGAVRCGVLIAEDECVFMRSVIGAKRLAFGARDHVTGPVVVEGEAAFGDDCRIGDEESATTVSAVSVRVGNGVVICGEVWARRQGVVRSLPSRTSVATTAA